MGIILPEMNECWRLISRVKSLGFVFLLVSEFNFDVFYSVSQANLLRPKGVSIFDDTRLSLHCAELNPLWIFNWKAQNSRFHSVHNSAHTVSDRQVWHPPCGSRLKSQGSIWLLWLLDSRALHWMTLIEAQRGLSHMMMHNNVLQQSSCN